MTPELKLLAGSVVLGLLQLIATSHLISWQRGYPWTAGTREEPIAPLRGLANRVDQATGNFLETFPFFAAVVLAAHVAHRLGPLTLCGAHLYFWGRIGYVLAAAAGYSLLRSVLFWNAAVAGILLIVAALFL
ncbi:MAG TPA: MAPEG family protein [Candidatus Udaeobacter sp.]|nr:MAPEG family protein [Candidatus Udaeobacter sp.]